jgi:cell wall-associated NlpC family hydrolase
MKKHLFILLITLTTLASCSSYPRYTKDPAVTPEQQISPGQMTTKEYIRLGQILQKYLGKPYAGSSKWEPGLDCSKFTRDVFREFNGTQLPRQAEDQFKAGRQANRRRLKFGDLVFFRTDGHSISHVGVYIGYNEFIHVSSSRGVIISGLSEKYWAERYVGARRILE